ncbi:MAG TPA: polysaccharide deacetylase family protein [Vicinamibacterales bacterium]|nr:polysaccharide deacetylase family protein [Vicinamibacterales bacterium]
MYHDVVEAGAEDASGFPGRDAAIYKVTTAQFEEHVAALKGCATSDADVAQAFRPAVTFDDGGVSAMVSADILERHGFIGHFFITTNYIGTRGFLDEPQIRELHARGHVIGSHSCTHPLRMGHCSWPQLLDEWKRSCDILGDVLHCDVRSASVPGGDFAPSVAEAAARAGITHLFTSEPTADARHAFGLTLQGRFTIQKWTTAETVAGLASGAWIPCARQAVVWNAKKLTKRLGGEQYLKMRKLLLRHGNEVRWGDL